MGNINYPEFRIAPNFEGSAIIIIIIKNVADLE